jgi:two-component system, cell cycle response regulator
VKILIAEDDPAFRNLLVTLLAKWGYDVLAAKDGDEAWCILQSEDAPQLAILDWRMPGKDGLEICRGIRSGKTAPYTYIILLTAQDRSRDIVAGMEAGADDYITKPFRTNELKARLRAGERIIEQQNELCLARDLLRAKATHDSLTGLLNHEEILRILGNELAKADREHTPVAVIMADIDNFKYINDSCGHLSGDMVLRLTAEKMQSLMRTYDSIGRYGGDEFMIILPGCDQQSAAALAERLRICIGGEKLQTPEGQIPVTISLGIGIRHEKGTLDAKSLIRMADAALYLAKENGRNRVEISEPPI